MKNSIEWFYALVSGKLVKPEDVFVKCPHYSELCRHVTAAVAAVTARQIRRIELCSM